MTPEQLLTPDALVEAEDAEEALEDEEASEAGVENAGSRLLGSQHSVSIERPSLEASSIRLLEAEEELEEVEGEDLGLFFTAVSLD